MANFNCSLGILENMFSIIVSSGTFSSNNNLHALISSLAETSISFKERSLSFCPFT